MSDSRQAQPAAETPVSPTPCPSLEGRGDSSDPEIAALLDFDPVPRMRDAGGGWRAGLEREFCARLGLAGSATKACDEMGKNQTGIMKLYRSPLAASFRAAWDGAVALAKQRQAERVVRDYVSPGTKPPTIDHRVKWRVPMAAPSEHEDESAMMRMAEEARDRITQKLLNARRLYLQEISSSPGKRAAFEILTELPIDWEKAERLEPQPDEPWRTPNMREPDMLLTAENGWLGDMAHGPDKKAELREAMDVYRREKGLPPIEWRADQ